MNRADRAELVAEVQQGRRRLKEHEAWVSDLRLEDLGIVGRVESDELVEDGVATSSEIYEGLNL